MKRPRDSYRSRVYKADDYATGGLCNSAVRPAAERLKTVPEIKAWVDKITSSNWWADYELPGERFWAGFESRYRHPKDAWLSIRVKDGRGRRKAGGSFLHGYITLPIWARSRHIILHELAHTIVEHRFAAHGPEFCRVLLDLTHEFLGFESAERLRYAYERCKVPYEDRGYTYNKDAA